MDVLDPEKLEHEKKEVKSYYAKPFVSTSKELNLRVLNSRQVGEEVFLTN